MIAENMRNDDGNKVLNQFIITDGSRRYFQSYDKLIAMENGHGNVKLSMDYEDMKPKTKHYLKLFLDESADRIQQKIETKTYQITQL